MIRFPLLRVNETDGYVDKLAKLVPADALTAYLAFISAAGDNTAYIWVSFFAAWAVLLFIRIYGAKNSQQEKLTFKKVDKVLLIISSAAFIIWVYTIGADKSGPLKDFYSPFVGTVLLVVFTLIAPYIHSGGTRIIRNR